MVPQSALEESTHTQHTRTLYSYRWMRHFFSTTTANDQHIDLQRRAVWIGLALILQSLNEIKYSLYMPYIQPFGSLIPFSLFLGSFYAIWRALQPARDQTQSTTMHRQPARWQRIILILLVLLSVAGFLECGYGIVLTFLPAQFTNDGTSIDTNAAIAFVEGHDPYNNSSILQIVRRFTIPAVWTTPLRQGQLAGRLDYPSDAELQAILNKDLKTNTASEFEGKVSYPPLSFLTLVPFVLLKDYNVLPFYIFLYLVLVAFVWKIAPREIRPWVLLLALANVPMWTSVVGSNLDILDILLLVLAWQQRNYRWRTALLLGLALATKQIAWYFFPFYLIMAWRHYGFKEMLYRLLIASGVALVFNVPFIIWNAHSWLAGIMAPVADPMFPTGVGLIDLSVTHLLPYFSGTVYDVLEVGTLLLALLAYWRICYKYPEAALLLAVLPLFFAWRSLPSYFYCTAFPVFILLIAKVKAPPISVATPVNASELTSTVAS